MLNILLLFVLGSILGSIIDTAYRSLTAGQFIHVSFLGTLTNSIIPFMPVYGFGLVIVYLLMPYIEKYNIIQKFLIYAISLTALEFLAGLFVLLFGFTLWDYSSNILNLFGIIDLLHAIYWGLLGILTEFLLRKLSKLPFFKTLFTS